MAAEQKDFFISYTSPDQAWAEWVAWELEEAKYTTDLQAWDFGPGTNFVARMHQAVEQCDATIALLSERYFRSDYTTAEWTSALARDPLNNERKLIPLRVDDCRAEGLLGPLAFIDLFGRSEEEAREAVLGAVRFIKKGRGRPEKKPRFPGSPTRKPRFPNQLPAVCNLPPRNPHFTGRRETLEQLRQTLADSGTTAVTAVSGLGGVGKSELAIEYGRRYHTHYEVLWWVRAESQVTLVTDVVALARKLGLAEEETADQEAAKDAAREWLRRNPGWLLILDNAPDRKACAEFLLPGAPGQTVVTSRNPNWRGVATPLEVNVLDRESAVKFLLERTGLDDDGSAGELCEALGDLPLALEQAAAYIETTGGTLASYLGLFREHAPELLARAGESGYPLSVVKTWEISIGRLEEENPPAVELLCLLAFVAPDDIPRELLAGHFENTLRFDEALAGLRRYSFVFTEGDGLAVHRLVQQVARERLRATGEEPKWAEAAAGLVNAAFRYEEHDLETWPASTRQMPHVLAACDHGERLGAGLKSVGRLLNDAGIYLQDRGRLGEAESALRRALAIDEKVHGPDHPEVAIRANNIGTILKAQGDLAGALEYARRALAIGEKVYGPDHPTVAIRANNIGQILQAQGDLAGALKYARRALAIDEKVYGPDHPEVATDANNIGQILQDQGDLAGALKYARRALAIGEKVHGPDHPTVARDANNIGTILKAQGDLPGALEYTRRALAIDETVYGPDHPTVATLANNIGTILKAQGDLAGALEYTRRALAIDEKVYGPDHPEVATDANNIGTILKAQGDLAGALEYTQRAHGILVRVYGPENPSTKIVAGNLRWLRERLGG